MAMEEQNCSRFHVALNYQFAVQFELEVEVFQGFAFCPILTRNMYHCVPRVMFYKEVAGGCIQIDTC